MLSRAHEDRFPSIGRCLDDARVHDRDELFKVQAVESVLPRAADHAICPPIALQTENSPSVWSFRHRSPSVYAGYHTEQS